MSPPNDPGAGPTGRGQSETGCGDRIEIHLWVERGTIVRAEFEMHGCQNTYAAARTLTHLVAGRSLTAALTLERDALLAAIGELPEGTEHVADLALAALRSAVLDALATERDPWKRLYR
jgi:NifU-like protein involved in Fe-S cluster formation